MSEEQAGRKDAAKKFMRAEGKGDGKKGLSQKVNMDKSGVRSF